MKLPNAIDDIVTTQYKGSNDVSAYIYHRLDVIVTGV